MMKNSQNNDFNYPTDTTITYDQTDFSYGAISGLDTLDLVEPVTSTDSLTFANQINYLFSEYFKGMAFVILTSIFIFAVPKLFLKQGSMTGTFTDISKRAMDIIGALVGLILTSPLWLLIPLLIKLTSRGPVFYSQVRVGINRRKKSRRSYQMMDVSERRDRDRRREDYAGYTFKVIKFRTMVNEAEKASGPVWATKNDPRITKLGNFLRKSRIDEIPQFINVLIGDMSLVGPRPERPKFVSELSKKVEGYADRLKVKPGITGMAQVENGYDTSVSSVVNKIRHDLDYINRQSIWLDIKILLKTVIVVITGKGAN